MEQESINTIEIPLSQLEYRVPNQEESQSLNVEYQGGMELMFWLSNLEADTLTKDITLKALQDAFDSLNNVKEYPIAEYNSVWHATFGLAIVFAEQIKYDFGWKWIMISKSPKVDVGWSLISPDNNYGINVEQIFYHNIMIKKPIEVIELYNSIEKAVKEKNAEEENIRFFTMKK